ncbi:hypothetical protein B2J88_50855 [Rhodococcus sp. SRB_17]|nr:hypothetical protein [Rhodococcus sp. SRB_17]
MLVRLIWGSTKGVNVARQRKCRFRIEEHPLFTSSLNPRQYEKLHGIFLAMCGVAASTGNRHSTGVPIAFLIMNFALTAAGVWILTDLIPR